MEPRTETAEASGQRPAGRDAGSIPRSIGSAAGPSAGRRTSPASLRQSLNAALEQRRFFLLLPTAAIAGLIAYVRAGAEPAPWAMGLIAVLLLLGLGFARRSIVVIRTLMLAASFWLGFCLLALHGAASGTVMLRGTLYGPYQARIDEVLSEEGATRRVIVSAVTPLGEGRVAPFRRARLFIRDGPPLAPGDLVAGPMRFYEVPGPVLPGGFDSQFHGYFEGIGAYASTTGALQVLASGAPSMPQRWVAKVRDSIARRVDAALVQPEAGIVRAIVNGDQSAVVDTARQTMATAGLAHVLSVSGLHLTIVAGGVYASLRLLLAAFGRAAGLLPVKRLAATGGIAAALLYFSISGGNVAAFRSTIMILLVFGAVIFGRRALTMRNVALAATLAIVVDPASIFRPSFQLSFAAVTALVGAFELTRGRRREDKDRGLVWRFFAYFGGLGATSLVAGAATLLFSAYHFQQTSPLGVFGNVVTLPLVGFVMMPSALFAVLAMPFGFEWMPLQVTGWAVARMLDVGAMVASLSAGIDASPLLTPLALVIGLLALAWFAFFVDRWRLVGPVLALPAVLLLALDRPPDLLIADTTQAVALRGPDGLVLAAGKPGSFAVDVWAETYGPIGTPGPGVVRCDSVGCIAAGAAGFTLAIIADPAGFAEECGTVDLVITRREAPAYCAGGSSQIVDAGDLARGGVQWLRWDAGSRRFKRRPAIADVNRPWRVLRR